MKVAVLGYGTVGFGVYEMLKKAEGLEAGPVLVRCGKDDEPFKVSSINAITEDDTVEAVAEVMGGVEPAFTYACAVLQAGKHFVTSNKALVAAKGTELAKLARENNAAFLFSAACGGGVPFLHNMALSVDTIILELLSLLPYAIPGIVMAIGVILTWSGRFKVNLYNTIWIILVAYLARYLSFSMKSASASLQQVHPSLEEAARSCGASHFGSLKDITFEQLSEKQHAELNSSASGTHNDIAAGGYLATIGVDYVTQTLTNSGSPIQFVYPEEDTVVIYGPMAIMKDTKNEEAAKVFFDWVLSKEGQQVLADASATPIRNDVTREGSLAVSEIHMMPDIDDVLMNEHTNEYFDKFDELFK